MNGANDKIVVTALKGQGGRIRVLVGLAQLDALVKAGAPPLGHLQAHLRKGHLHPGTVAVGKILTLAVVGESVGPQAQLLGALAHLQNRVAAVERTARVVMTVASKAVFQCRKHFLSRPKAATRPPEAS